MTPTEITDTLRAERVLQKIGAETLAAELRRHSEAVYRWERGNTYPRLDFLFDWAEALDMEIVVRRKGYVDEIVEALCRKAVDLYNCRHALAALWRVKEKGASLPINVVDEVRRANGTVAEEAA
jgi:transcriptional regulator with XRE-family HTH domain